MRRRKDRVNMFPKFPQNWNTLFRSDSSFLLLTYNLSPAGFVCLVGWLVGWLLLGWSCLLSILENGVVSSVGTCSRWALVQCSFFPRTLGFALTIADSFEYKYNFILKSYIK